MILKLHPLHSAVEKRPKQVSFPGHFPWRTVSHQSVCQARLQQNKVFRLGTTAIDRAFADDGVRRSRFSPRHPHLSNFRLKGALTFAVHSRRAGESVRANARVRSGRVQAPRVNSAQIRLANALVHIVTGSIGLPGITFRADARKRAVQIVTLGVSATRRRTTFVHI